MKIYTRNGDSGTTSLLGGTRVSKHDLRIEAYGTVDELNAQLGCLSDQEMAAGLLPLIREIQHSLFVIGSHLANDPEVSHFKLPDLPESGIERLEQSMDEMDAVLPQLRNFVLPGGHPANSTAHVARCVCRRAERRIVELSHHTEVNPLIIKYINRLSDWLFVCSRYMSHLAQVPEIAWHA